jgi:hypothetical protein
MDELRQAPTRELNHFEATALKTIRGGEPIMFEQEGDNLRMMGSLLAAEQCTNCHAVQRSDLLGAFSSQFGRDPALPEAKAIKAL